MTVEELINKLQTLDKQHQIYVNYDCCSLLEPEIVEVNENDLEWRTMNSNGEANDKKYYTIEAW